MGIKRLALLTFFVAISLASIAQNGTVKGLVTDQMSNESLVGATIMLEGTIVGTITDFDGNYVLPKITPGTYNVRCSFISYEPITIESVEIRANQTLEFNFDLSESTLQIEDIQVVAIASRESETMLLLDQKKASGIKESIGSNRLSSLGVSDAASATSKISGVTKNESSGDVYIRGLGDRYLTTTMNGLPIPSDDVEKKNIDLNLFSTNFIKNVGIDKTFSVETYADQSSGTVNINSKTFSETIIFGITGKTNTNILQRDNWNNFKTTQNMNDVSFGVHQRSYYTEAAIKKQSWNTETQKLPMGYEFSFSAGKKFKLFNNEMTVFATASNENSHEYHQGIYKKYRSNVLDNSFTDAETFGTKINTTGLINLTYNFNDDHILNFNSLSILKTIDQLYEQGRNGEGYVFDQDPQEEGAFIRDQNLKTTQIFINQLLGTHALSDKNKVEWALGYNLVNSEEPNRIRNEVNIVDDNTVQFAHVGDFQQRKTLQEIDDTELNGYLKDILSLYDKEHKKLKLNYGANFRVKERTFRSLFIGVRAKGFQIESIDNLDEAFLNTANYSSTGLVIKERNPDLYNANLNVYAAYANTYFELNKVSGSLGLRYEMDDINVSWDVANYVGRTGRLSNSYNNILPALNFKYSINDNSSLRMAASKTITLPEFKELSPFEYVSPTGRVTKGNPSLKRSVNYNFDIKWEMFPQSNELVSVTGFYKKIQDPINLAQTRGSSGNFIYENTGKKADVYGLELETRLSLINPENTRLPELNIVLNATKMWFNQDLLDEFQYNNKTESNLQGAAGFIMNATLSFANNKEKEFIATINGNYSSNKILALGAPEDYENSSTLFNNEIIEKGFTSVDIVISQKISKTVSLKLSGKNLLNPKIEQTQIIEPLSGDASNELVSSYKKGINLSIGVNIYLNN